MLKVLDGPSYFLAPYKLEASMRRISLVIALFIAVPVGTAYAQAPLPQSGQPGQQQRQGGQPGRPAFGNPQGNAGQGQGQGPVDPAYMQKVSYGIGRDFAMRLRENEIQLDMQ